MRYAYRILVIVICIFTSSYAVAQSAPPSNKVKSIQLDQSTSLSSLNLLCDAISNCNLDLISQLCTTEGFETIYSDRGVESLVIDVIFWKEAIKNGKIFVSEKIETEREYLLLLGVDEYQILSIHSSSNDKMMLIEKLTFVKVKGKWKFMLFSTWEK